MALKPAVKADHILIYIVDEMVICVDVHRDRAAACKRLEVIFNRVWAQRENLFNQFEFVAHIKQWAAADVQDTSITNSNSL